MTDSRSSASRFLSLREPSPAKSDCGSERSGKRRGVKWFKSIRKAVGAIGGFRKRPAEPVQPVSLISVEQLDLATANTVIIQDIRKERPKGPPGRRRSANMKRQHSQTGNNSQNTSATVPSITEETMVEESQHGNENGGVENGTSDVGPVENVRNDNEVVVADQNENELSAKNEIVENGGREEVLEDGTAMDNEIDNGVTGELGGVKDTRVDSDVKDIEIIEDIVLEERFCQSALGESAA